MTGKQRSVTGWCCWKPLWTRSVFAGPCIGRRTGCTSGTRRDFTALAGGTPRRRNLPRWSSSNPCGPTPARCCRKPFFLPLIKSEVPKSCSAPRRCNLSPRFSARFPIPAAPKAGAIACPPCWASPPEPSCAACAATRRSPIGPQSLGPKARERFGCRREKGRYVVPSESIIRNVLIRVDPAHLDRALRRWNRSLRRGGRKSGH